jgi:hypothetical protein
MTLAPVIEMSGYPKVMADLDRSDRPHLFKLFEAEVLLAGTVLQSARAALVRPGWRRRHKLLDQYDRSCRLGVDELTVLAVGEGGGARSHGDGGAGESQQPVVGS